MRTAAETEDGKYEILLDGKAYPVLSVVSLHIHDTKKLTVSSIEKSDGKIIPFCDKVYPVVFSAENTSFSVSITHTACELPKILLDGNTKVFADGNGEQECAITYPIDSDNKPLVIFSDFPTQPEASGQLHHMDKLQRCFGDSIIRTVYWNQISKI